MRIIRQYLLKEIFSIFALSLVIVTVLFMSQRIIQLTEWSINRGIGAQEIARLLIFLLPNILLIIIPIVTLFSILLAVGRLSSDNEIVSLKACGVSLFRLTPPILLFAVFASGLALFAAQELGPRAAQATRSVFYRITRTKTEAAVVERVFVSINREVTLYVREKKPDGEMVGIMACREERPEGEPWVNRQFAFARSGRFVNDPVKFVNELWLFDGVLIQEDRREDREDFATFTTSRFKLNLKKFRNKRDDVRQELEFFEMQEAIARLEPNARLGIEPDADEYLKLKIQWHERIAFPLGCVALCFWALPLGIQPPRAGRARGMVVSVVLSAFFYYLMIMAKFAALNQWADPWAALWFPNIVIVLTGLYMLRQKNLEQPIFLLTWVEDQTYHWVDLIKQYVEKRRSA